MGNSSQRHSRTLAMLALVLGGELAFSLPFHLPRYFRPTLLEVYGLSHADMGDIFVAYGAAALISYFPGGVIADHYSARKLMGVSLFATAAGGLYMLAVPGRLGLVALYAFWGVTSILLFWSALIRATREWGGRLEQGRGFGLLDAGRGVVAAATAAVGVAVLRDALGTDPLAADAVTREAGLRGVTAVYTVATAIAGLVVWRWVPDSDPDGLASGRPALSGLRRVLSNAAVWHQAAVVVAAYCAYKALDQYSVYAVDVMGMNEADAAAFVTLIAWIRPVGALLGGLAGDRLEVSRALLFVFAGAVASWGAMATLDTGVILLIFATVSSTCLATYALRGLYFALLEQSRVPRLETGAAIGLISFVGYTPDVFFGPVSGRLLDATPGLGGYQHMFLLLVLTSLAGMASSGWLHRRFGSRRWPRPVGRP